MKQLQRNLSAIRSSGPMARHGFTLIELLVVVAIIALLISILLPSLQSARNQAKSVVCLSNSRGMGQASMIFAEDHRGRMQLATTFDAMRRADRDWSLYEYGNYVHSTGRRELLTWTAALGRVNGIDYGENYDWGVRASDRTTAQSKLDSNLLLEKFDLPVCPADKVGVATPFYPQGTEQLVAPGHPDDPGGVAGDTKYYGRLSYGINEDIVGADHDEDVPSCYRDGHIGESGDQAAGKRLLGRLDQIKRASEVLLLVDAGPDLGDDASGYANLIISAKAQGPELQDFQQAWQLRLPRDRHPKGALNVTFADGHGSRVFPSNFENFGGRKKIMLPTRYSEPVRISPY